MNILLINHYAGSPKYGMAYRPFYLGKEWVKLGHKTTILGANFSHLRTNQPYIEKDFTQENIEDLNYIWIKTPSYNSSGIRRIINILFFVFKLIFNFKKIAQMVKPDVVISSSTYPLDIYPAYLIAKRAKAKLIFELHDMWPLSPMIIGGYSKWHPFIWLIQKAENFACRKCDGYVSMLGNTENYLIKHGLTPGKFAHIPNGFLEEEWLDSNEEIPVEHTNLIRKLRDNNKIIIGYTGGHGPSNALGVVVEAARIINDARFVFVLVGNGPQKEDLIKKATKLKLDNIYFLPTVSKKCIPNLLVNFDILYAGGVSSILHSYGTSFNKLADYMLAEKPIIFAVDEPNSTVERVGCGLQIPAENKDALLKAIFRLSNISKEERIQMGKSGKKFALTELNYKALAKKFIETIESF